MGFDNKIVNFWKSNCSQTKSNICSKNDEKGGTSEVILFVTITYNVSNF